MIRIWDIKRDHRKAYQENDTNHSVSKIYIKLTSTGGRYEAENDTLMFVNIESKVTKVNPRTRMAMKEEKKLQAL